MSTFFGVILGIYIFIYGPSTEETGTLGGGLKRATNSLPLSALRGRVYFLYRCV